MATSSGRLSAPGDSACTVSGGDTEAAPLASLGTGARRPGSESDATPSSSPRGRAAAGPGRDRSTRLGDLLQNRQRSCLVHGRRVVDTRPETVELAHRLAPPEERRLCLAKGTVKLADLALRALQRLVPPGVARSEPLDAARPVASLHGARHGLEIAARHRLQQSCSSHRKPPSRPALVLISSSSMLTPV